RLGSRIRHRLAGAVAQITLSAFPVSITNWATPPVKGMRIRRLAALAGFSKKRIQAPPALARGPAAHCGPETTGSEASRLIACLKIPLVPLRIESNNTALLSGVH